MSVWLTVLLYAAPAVLGCRIILIHKRRIAACLNLSNSSAGVVSGGNLKSGSTSKYEPTIT